MQSKLFNYIRKNLSYFAIALWAIPISLCLSLLMGLHLSPHPKDQLRGVAAEEDFSVHHFLSLKCSCSQKLIQHLLNRKALISTNEVVHLIHPEAKVAQQLESAGYKVESIGEEASVRKYNLQSLPLLVISRNKEILYQGGYARDQQHTQAYEDEKIIATARDNKKIQEYVVLGCANGSLRKKMTDIMGAKYERN